jgi:beta-glucosidase
VPAMLWSSFNGQRKGESLADVVLGNYNPSGRLPFTWYQTNSQLPAITDYSIRPNGSGSNPGRTYMYFTGAPKYAFGHGLSYTSFAYSNLQIDDFAPDANDTIHVSADVTNTGTIAGNEVVQLYVSTPDSPAALERPRKRLEGFQKVSLGPNQTATVTFTLPVSQLAFFDQTLGKWMVDNTRYGIQISKSSADADIQLQDFVQVTGTLTPVPSVVTAKPTLPTDAADDIPARLLFPGGAVVDPKLTVAMSDDTLYGYIAKGASRPFPDGMTFQYSSNRPGVVSVDGSGVIRTVSAGVATVTATVTYAGVSKSADFVLYVTSSPTAVAVRSFSASRSPGDVVLRWRTAAEGELLGFDLYRSRGASRVKLNRRLIASAAFGAAGGQSYIWRDRAPVRRGRYWLQEVRLDGERVLHGPVAPR